MEEHKKIDVKNYSF